MPLTGASVSSQSQPQFHRLPGWFCVQKGSVFAQTLFQKTTCSSRGVALLDGIHRKFGNNTRFTSLANSCHCLAVRLLATVVLYSAACHLLNLCKIFLASSILPVSVIVLRICLVACIDL